jgi:multiple sugar transport system substrate-binding protein
MSPLIGSIPDFNKIHPELEIIWDSRSLYDFGEGNLKELLNDYDLIIFDHPYTGEISDNKWFIDLSTSLSVEERSVFENDSLGSSWRSYQTVTGIWGLPIDSAAQVASYRPDLLDRLQTPIPRSIAEVFKLAEKAREHDSWVALPLAPCDAICTFMTLAANSGSAIARDGCSFPGYDECIRILRAMKKLAGVCHPDSTQWNPIACYDYMSANQDVCYVPFAFGYTNYSRNPAGSLIKFSNIPGMDSDSCSGAVLGGAGIGVSARSQHPGISIEYAKMLCKPGYQGSRYFSNYGQPASLKAWQVEENDKKINGFFSGTMETMKQSYLRPTLPGFLPFFREAGKHINAYLRGEMGADTTTQWLIANYSSPRSEP